ncbi:MAG: hypothetical protein H7Y22_07390 [Gemmatimonadaceae bacterium]|nr:hypothetical protein [Gloeobacterales cyanobacterium ES-bin-141]
MNLKHVKYLIETLTARELEARVCQIEAAYFQASPEIQEELLDEVGDYLKALDVRLQIEQTGIDRDTALRDLAHRMRSLGSAHVPFSEWVHNQHTGQSSLSGRQ